MDGIWMLTSTPTYYIIKSSNHPLTIPTDGNLRMKGRSLEMYNPKSLQKNFYLQVGDRFEIGTAESQPACESTDCNIEIQVGGGWAVSGYYRNRILQTVKLQKTLAKQD
jgi:hypothetical protein